jgi:hypothetical protein
MQMQDARSTPAEQHPDWFDPSLDYGDELHPFARQFGESAGAVSFRDWSTAEPILQSVWESIGDSPWLEVRVIVYSGWRTAKRRTEVIP